AGVRVLRAFSPVLDPARRGFGDLAGIFRTIGPYGCDIDNFAENWRSALGYGIPAEGQSTPLPNGFVGPLHFFRIEAIAATDSIHGFARDPGRLANKDPYPAPCKYSPGPRYPENPGQGAGR